MASSWVCIVFPSLWNGWQPLALLRALMSDPLILPPTAAWIIRPDELELNDDAHLGGRIAQGRWRNSLVIVKVLSKQAEAGALHERGQLWTSLHHPNVLQMFGISPLDADPLYVVTQFQTNGNVMRFLQQNPHADRAKIVSDIACGMQYIHANSVVHGNLKPVNVLISADGSACISDCGMIEVQTSGSHGHRYFSPEAWKGTVSRPSDVFAWAMTALEIFTSKAPWGILSEKQIFRLVVRQDSRPDRPDEDFGITDHIWGIMEECWHRESRLRPTFDILVQLLQNNVGRRIQPDSRSSSSLSIPRVQVISEPVDNQHLLLPGQAFSPGDSLAALHSNRPRHALSMITQSSGPPAYEVMSSIPGSAPPSMGQFRASVITTPPPKPKLTQTDMGTPPQPQFMHEGSDASSTSASPNDSLDEDGMSPMFDNLLNLQSPDTPMTPWSPERRLAPSPSIRSIRTSSSGGSSRSQNSRTAPTRLRNIDTIGEEPHVPGYESPRNVPSPSPTPRGYSKSPVEPTYLRHMQSTSTFPSEYSVNSAPKMYPEPAYLKHALSTNTFPSEYSSSSAPNTFSDPSYLKHTPSTSTFPSDYSASTALTSANAYAESVRSQPSTLSGTAPNANLLAGALLSEVKEGRKREVIDGYLDKIQKLGMSSHKEAQKLVTAGTIPTLILLLKTRAVDGIGLETVLLALGILTHDPITANTIYRTSTSATLIEIVDAARSDEIAALAVWCLARICRTPEVATGLLKLNLGKLLVTKGLKGGQRTARISAWCIGALVRSDSIADSLQEMGLVSALCEHMRRCSESINAGPEDHSSIIYAVARISRSIKISKALAKGGCVEMLAHYLNTAEDPQMLLWSARAVGCLMRPNSSDMAKVLLEAGIARGLARLPSMLATEEVEPLGAFAFAIQRFSCAEWGGGTRKQLVDAGVVDALLAALRTAADEPHPEVHIELAYAIALLGDVGGTSIRKEIVNAGGIDILKRVGAAAARADVTKACNLAVTSITGNVWSRNAASAKAALAHEWTGGCPDYLPECPLPLPSAETNNESW
ncbi:hypothetical protein B0H17DRAFT_1023203 [Mycena rosella]|uniref:Protein kinase domain-containing protein n=1 Tax=Mycena rosella TaxID=1033263 RepID=A0AAD7FSD2_MYCRO|nr:hypothetical protein B0H17DRAFT_1023203 [Mycena rosella]